MLSMKLSIKDNCFKDAEGRHVLLHGIGLVDKNPANGYLGFLDPALFAAFRQWGFNCIRLGVIWDGLEPQPGVFNESYLQGIDRQVELAWQNGLYVVLDMHQDLYSVLFSDGAPEWATLTDGQPHLEDSEVWSDAYFTSPAVQTALDHFWDNTPAEDGVALQDHFAAAWRVLAQRYASHPAVIGYDLLNEPFPGSVAQQAQLAMFARGAEVLAAAGMVEGGPKTPAEGGQDPVESLMQTWLSPAGRYAILQILRDIDVYAPVVDVQQAFYNPFERTKLMALYQRTADAIRQVDAQGMLFLETTMVSNMGVSSAIEPVTDAEGRRDPYQVYAPHGYDLVTDTPFVADASPERVGFIFGRHAETAQRLQMPLWVGEWGAYGNFEGSLRPAWDVVRLFEQMLCSETFWAYFPGVESTPSFPAVQRPYPMCTAGRLIAYTYSTTDDTFTCEWEESVDLHAPTRLYLPDWFHLSQRQVEIHPAAGEIAMIPLGDDSGNCIIEIPSTRQNIRRSVRIFYT